MSTTHQRVAMPSRRITDPKFKYTNAVTTDVRRTFRKVRLYLYLKGKAS